MCDGAGGKPRSPPPTWRAQGDETSFCGRDSDLAMELSQLEDKSSINFNIINGHKNTRTRKKQHLNLKTNG